MSKKVVPPSASNTDGKASKIPKATKIDYAKQKPAWRIGHFDYKSKWGLNQLGTFTFVFGEKLLSLVIDNEPLFKTLDDLNGKTYSSIDAFWGAFKSHYNGSEIPIEVVTTIEQNFFSNVFFEKIYPKLQSFEENTWDEIRLYTHRKGNGTASNNHYVLIKNLIKEAQDRLNTIGYSDRDEIYSLRLEGAIRVYGFREMNYLDIIWIDLNHEIYEVHR